MSLGGAASAAADEDETPDAVGELFADPLGDDEEGASETLVDSATSLGICESTRPQRTALASCLAYGDVCSLLLLVSWTRVALETLLAFGGERCGGAVPLPRKTTVESPMAIANWLSPDGSTARGDTRWSAAPPLSLDAPPPLVVMALKNRRSPPPRFSLRAEPWELMSPRWRRPVNGERSRARALAPELSQRREKERRVLTKARLSPSERERLLFSPSALALFLALFRRTPRPPSTQTPHLGSGDEGAAPNILPSFRAGFSFHGFTEMLGLVFIYTGSTWLKLHIRTIWFRRGYGI
jgi:hypothetical protein